MTQSEKEFELKPGSYVTVGNSNRKFWLSGPGTKLYTTPPTAIAAFDEAAERKLFDKWRDTVPCVAGLMDAWLASARVNRAITSRGEAVGQPVAEVRCSDGRGVPLVIWRDMYCPPAGTKLYLQPPPPLAVAEVAKELRELVEHNVNHGYSLAYIKQRLREIADRLGAAQ